MSEKFLIDTNSLIEPFRNYYPFDLAPNFWKQLKRYIESGDVLLLDIVEDEILKGSKDTEDDLAKWIKLLDKNLVISRKNIEILAKYGEVLQFIQNSDNYTAGALNEWSRESVADPWLIACAAVNGYTIVTRENRKGESNPGRPTSKPKIPNVAFEFNVRCVDLWYMMRSLKFKL